MVRAAPKDLPKTSNAIARAMQLAEEKPFEWSESDQSAEWDIVES